jgi:hypothetical protein
VEDRGLGLLDATFTLLMLCVGVAAIWAFLAGATDVTGRKISSSGSSSSGDWWWSYGSKDTGDAMTSVDLPQMVTSGRGLEVGSVELVQPQWPTAVVVPAAAPTVHAAASSITTATAAAAALQNAGGVSAAHKYEPIP